MPLICVQLIWKRTLPGQHQVMITAGKDRLIPDQRFSVDITGNSQRRTCKLRIENIGREDQGVYTCVIPTVPAVSADVHITVFGGKYCNIRKHCFASRDK